LRFEQSLSPPVYIVDDNALVRESTVFLLGTNGVRCRAFDDGASFLAEVQDLPDGCLLIDRLMPRVSGVEVIQRLSAINRKMPIILMTAATNSSRTELDENIDPHMLLEKPFEEDALLSALETGFKELALGAEGDATNVRDVVAHLTSNQTLILRGLIAGMDTAALALRFGVAESLVRRNRVALKARIAATDVYHAVAIGRRSGLLPLQHEDVWEKMRS
jgi:FixJ family two-component response regulator